jgi:pyruvate/2-oxoglutarate dehydrogenase complex dihydrolipoamide acyltransferase (E2) component
MQGTVVSIDVGAGDVVAVGRQLLVLESMKMEHVIAAEWAGTVTDNAVEVGQTVMPGDALVLVEPGVGADASAETERAAIDLDHVRADLAEALERHDIGLDHRRPEAVARRRASGQRTARENVGRLVDDGSFVEYAPLVVAAQRRRRPLQS